MEGIYQAGIPSDTNTGQEPKRRASEGGVVNDTNIRWQKKIHEGVTILSLRSVDNIRSFCTCCFKNFCKKIIKEIIDGAVVVFELTKQSQSK